MFVILALAMLVVASCAQPLPNIDDTDESTSDDPLPGPTDTSAGVDTSTTATLDTGTNETGELGCGNGIVEAGETCDDGGESATCDADCTEVSCGDGSVNAAAGEECEGVNLAGGTCEGLGFDGGTLSCGQDCSYDTNGCVLPDAPVLELDFSQVKRFDFTWAAVAGADYYQLLESASPGDPFVQLGGDIAAESISLEMPLHFRHAASYVLRACNAVGCTDSAVVDVVGSLEEAVGYFKASNTDESDRFGFTAALSGDGHTLAVGALFESSNAMGIGGSEVDDSAGYSGAAYVFAQDRMGTWSQQAYVKASNTGAGDHFGHSVALSADGNTLAVGALGEASNATGIGGTEVDDSEGSSGAVYVFVRDGMGAWSQQAYVKASNTSNSDNFGYSVALSADGNTLAVGALGEDSNATGIDGTQADDSASDSGAVYVFSRGGISAWSQQAYVKASNTDAGDYFGYSVALSADGNTLAVGANQEDSNATGIDGIQSNDSASSSGATYVFARDGMGAWSQQAYLKASNTDASDIFGSSVALNADGDTLAVGAHQENSNASGIGGDQDDDSSTYTGAVYVFGRDGMGSWSQQAYVKASNTGAGDRFGHAVALSGDGNILAVGANREDSNALGIGGTQADDSASESGAVYVFARGGMGTWSQQAYIKASNTGSIDYFGYSVALSADAETLLVGASREDSNATGISGDQADESAPESGAVYLY